MWNLTVKSNFVAIKKEQEKKKHKQMERQAQSQRPILKKCSMPLPNDKRTTISKHTFGNEDDKVFVC